jgi:hypothetical protein
MRYRFSLRAQRADLLPLASAPGKIGFIIIAAHPGPARVAINGPPAPFAALPCCAFPSGDPGAYPPSLSVSAMTKPTSGEQNHDIG